MTRASRGESRLEGIELQRVSVRLGRHWALRDVSFSLRAGERWLLQGPNGAGKTVLLKLLRGDLWPTPRGPEARRYCMSDGAVLQQPFGASDRIAYLGPERQDRYERHESTLDVAQVVHTGFDDSDFPLTQPTVAQAGRISEVLTGVGLAGLARRRFRSLSYGQRRRILLARALVRQPDVLLLDEALNGLDAASRRAFLRALQRTATPRTAWVLSTHRCADAPAGTTHLARLEGGVLIQSGRLPTNGARSIVSAAALRCGRKVPAVVRAARVEPGVLLRLQHASVFRDERRVVGTFEWTLVRGQHWHVTGANGAGKSTLLALLYGDLWPAAGGMLERGGQRPMPVEDWKRRVGLVSPELQATYAVNGCTVTQIVASGLHSSIGLDAVPTSRELSRIQRALREWGVEALAERHARELSYGQLRLVLVARACITQRQLYLLDEPFDGLDARARDRFCARLDSARSRGATIVIATHHADDVPTWVTNTLRCRAGRAPVVCTSR
jgi:molybdate transport system ATP-binding protein